MADANAVNEALRAIASESRRAASWVTEAQPRWERKLGHVDSQELLGVVEDLCASEQYPPKLSDVLRALGAPSRAGPG